MAFTIAELKELIQADEHRQLELKIKLIPKMILKAVILING